MEINEPKQHFSHNHVLISLDFDEDEKVKCKACNNFIFDPSFHGCKTCKFYLHNHCMNLPRSLNHPAHLSHPLALFPIPTYSNLSYTCNACGTEGKAFSYSCAHCEYDLHVQCACKPADTIELIENHPDRDLKLTTFKEDDKNTKGKAKADESGKKKIEEKISIDHEGIYKRHLARMAKAKEVENKLAAEDLEWTWYCREMNYY